MKKLITTLGCTAAILTGAQAQSIVIDSLQGSRNFGLSPSTNYCKGASFNVYANVAGFSAGKTFTVQLSSPTGTFSAPKNIGTAVAATGNGSLTIPVQIPEVQGIGSNFRVRVVSTSPNVASADNGYSLTILQRPAGFETNLTPTGTQVKICAGNTVTIATTPNATYTYQWMRNGDSVLGANTHSLSTTDSGTYQVRVTTSLGCLRSSGTRKVMLYPTPVGNFSTYTLSGGTVRLTATQSGSGSTYQWYRDGNLISGATARVYVATMTGSYHVVTSRYGCTTTGSAQNIVVNSARSISSLSVADETTSPILVYPNPSSSSSSILVSGSENEQFTVRIYDMSGRVVETHTTVANDEISFGAQLPAGMYTIEAISNAQRLISRWVKQ